MARPVPIPVPLKGMNTVNPFNDSLEYARELSDFQIYQGRLSPRPSRDTVVSSAYVGQINWVDVSSAPIYYAISNTGDRIRLDTGAVLGNIGGACQISATTVNHVGTTFLFGCQAPRQATGPAFTAWTFTTAAITAANIACGCSWKGRLYVSDGISIEYSNLGSTGASVLNGGVPISYNMGGESVVRMLVLTASSQANVLTDSLFCIFGNQGLVLMYSGTDPTDWQLIGRYQMPLLNSNISFVEIDGDIFVANNSYAYWARDLLIGGATYAYNNSPTRAIENLWQSVIYDSLASNALVSHAFYLDKVESIPIDAIIVQCSVQNTDAAQLDKISNTGPGCCFAYFRKYKAWAIWFLSFPAPVIKSGTDYFCTGSGANAALFDIVYLDSNSIQPTWSTPYLSPFIGRNQRLLGARPFFQSPEDPASITIAGIADFSDFLSPFSFQAKDSAVSPVTPGLIAVTTAELPVNSYEQYHPFAAIGVIGAGASLYARFNTISADPLSNQIYQMIAYFEDGGDLY